MPAFTSTKSIYYDDVNIIAQPQNLIKSREDIPKELERIIVSPMSAIIGKTFALEAYRLGLTVCLHRFGTVETQLEILDEIRTKYGRASRCWVSVGLNDWDRVRKLQHTHILVDVANGYLEPVIRFTNDLLHKGYFVMVGNIHTAKGLNLYRDVICRVNIASGGACDTNKMTGVNRGQITEIMECREGRYADDQKICADGGIKSPGDAAKAFGAGSDYVMLGGYWKNAKEAQNVIDGEFKFWGGASKYQQMKQKGEVKRHSEGKVLEVEQDEIVPLEELVNDLWGGISSAVSYSGHASLTDFIGNAQFELKYG
jgi:IMP dehydrogenase/GMP reductase